jgi:hypothetical protein
MRRAGDLREQFPLQWMRREAVALRLVSPRPTEDEKAGVLPRARVLEGGRVWARFEVGLRRGRGCKQCSHSIELLGTVAVGCAGDRDFPVGEIRPRSHERQHLKRLGRRTEERHPTRIACLGNDLPILHRNGVDPV